MGWAGCPVFSFAHPLQWGLQSTGAGVAPDVSHMEALKCAEVGLQGLDDLAFANVSAAETASLYPIDLVFLVVVLHVRSATSHSELAFEQRAADKDLQVAGPQGSLADAQLPRSAVMLCQDYANIQGGRLQAHSHVLLS